MPFKWDSTVGKTLRAAIYLGLSSLIAALIAAVAKDAMLFGALTPVINIVLVLIKNFLDKNTDNV